MDITDAVLIEIGTEKWLAIPTDDTEEEIMLLPVPTTLVKGESGTESLFEKYYEAKDKEKRLCK